MAAETLPTPRFIRKTQLSAGEYRKNFHQIDDEIIAVVTSLQADQVTPLMSKIYLRLVRAPAQYWEREGVLRFEAEFREEGKSVKAWAALCELLGVASATASKALSWMHDTGVIGYFAGKNGVGIRIFLNRAASSIGTRQASGGKKILEFAPASSVERRASLNEAGFKDTYGDLENSDTDNNSSAPEDGAESKEVGKNSSEPHPPQNTHSQKSDGLEGRNFGRITTAPTGLVSVEALARYLRSELEPSLQTAARTAAAREHERTREWLETRGLPKAARVAQREAYNVLRQHGVVGSASAQRARTDLEVGRNHSTPVEAKPLSGDDVQMFAEMCLSMLESHGQEIDVTLAEISSEAGGCLLPEDAPRVREAARLMAHTESRKE